MGIVVAESSGLPCLRSDATRAPRREGRPTGESSRPSTRSAGRPHECPPGRPGCPGGVSSSPWPRSSPSPSPSGSPVRCAEPVCTVWGTTTTVCTSPRPRPGQRAAAVPGLPAAPPARGGAGDGSLRGLVLADRGAGRDGGRPGVLDPARRRERDPVRTGAEAAESRRRSGGGAVLRTVHRRGLRRAHRAAGGPGHHRPAARSGGHPAAGIGRRHPHPALRAGRTAAGAVPRAQDLGRRRGAGRGRGHLGPAGASAGAGHPGRPPSPPAPPCACRSSSPLRRRCGGWSWWLRSVDVGRTRGSATGSRTCSACGSGATAAVCGASGW